MEQPAGSDAAEPGTADAGTAGPEAVGRPAADTRASAPPVRDPQESDPKPRSLLARVKLFFFRTTLGRTRRDKSDV